MDQGITRRSSLALAAGLVAAPGIATAQEPTVQSLVEGAKKEGQLVVWVSSPGRPETHKALFEAFNTRFGLSIRAEWSPASSVSTGQRLVAEQGRSGPGQIDVVGAGGAEEISILLERGIVKPWPWARVLGKELPQLEAVAGAAMADIRDVGLPVLDAVYGIAWNPDLVKDEEVPSTYAELLDPKWRTRVALNAFSLIPLDSFSFLIGRDKTLEMARRMVENRPVLERGTPAVSRAITVGQAPVGVTTYHAAARSGTREKPQKFKLFSDVIPVFPIHVYVPENAPHPNAARLFASWLATEGMAITNRTELAPRISDAGSELAEMVKAQIARTGAKIATPASLKAVAEVQQVREAITAIIAGK